MDSCYAVVDEKYGVVELFWSEIEANRSCAKGDSLTSGYCGHVDEMVITGENPLKQPLDNVSRLYEELRQITDGGSESMTHEDAVAELKSADERCVTAETKIAWAIHAIENTGGLPVNINNVLGMLKGERGFG